MEGTNTNTRSAWEVANMSIAAGCEARYIDSGEGNVTGSYFAVMVINDTVFTELKDSNNEISSTENLADDQFSEITVPAGIVLYGTFTSITVSSGLVCAYKAD
jgi:hypothetical protein